MQMRMNIDTYISTFSVYVNMYAVYGIIGDQYKSWCIYTHVHISIDGWAQELLTCCRTQESPV